MSLNAYGGLARNSLRIAVIIPLDGEPNQERINGILRYASGNPEWDVFVMGSHKDSETLDDISNWHPDGIITTPEYFAHRTRMSHCKAKAYAIANGRDFRPPGYCSNFGAIVCDNVGIGRIAAQFFLKRQFRNFAYVGMPRPQTWSNDRMAGFCDELAKAGHQCHIFKSSRKRDWQTEAQSLARFLSGLPKPCALLSSVDRRAKHVLDVCRLTGIDVPGQISVMGVDNEKTTCEWTQPSLSSIHPEFEQSGYRLAEMLDNLLHGRRVSPRTQTYGVVGIVERRSTLDTTGAARIISLAREFIRINATSNITVRDIAAAARCSVRCLQRHFKNTAMSSPVDELVNRRLELVCNMLLHSETPVDRVGEFCGFSSNSYLKATFKRHFGIPMTEWRKRNLAGSKGSNSRLR